MQCGVSSTWIECPEFFHDFRLLRSAVILFRSGLNVIDGCVAGDEIEIESVGRSGPGLKENEATQEDETERRKERRMRRRTTTRTRGSVNRV